MDLFDWDQFNMSDDVDISEILGSVPPFDAQVSPQPAGSSDAGSARPAECRDTQPLDTSGQYSALEGRSYGLPHPQVRPRPRYPNLTYWMSSAS